MEAFTKAGFAALVIIVLICTPVGFCAAVAHHDGPPAHPCCPDPAKQVPVDCARPGCVYIDTSLAPAAPDLDTAAVIVAPLPAPVLAVPVLPAAAPAPASPPTGVRPDPIVAHCQFRI